MDSIWRVLGGPEKEKGDPVQIIESTGDDITVSVQRRRGTVMRSFSATSLPATITFRFQSNFDPRARELPTDLFGTGDFRIFVGSRGILARNSGNLIPAMRKISAITKAFSFASSRI